MNQTVLFCAKQCALLWNLWHNYPHLCCSDWNQFTVSQPCITPSVPVFILLSLFNIWHCFVTAALMKSLKSIQGWRCHRASQVNSEHFVENDHRHSLDLSVSLNLKSSLLKAESLRSIQDVCSLSRQSDQPPHAWDDPDHSGEQKAYHLSYSKNLIRKL